MVSQTQNPIFVLDGLYCEEETFEEDLDLGVYGESFRADVKNPSCISHLLAPFEHDLFWEEDELLSLLSKEKESYFCTHMADSICVENGVSSSLMVTRKEGLDWMVRVSNHYGFVSATTVLAVNYFDRFLLSPCFQSEKPWMAQLAAVACLSLAAKVEETQVPLLLDLQVEDSKFVFESKTVMRMEILVLSTLQWRMNPVTPLSFFDYVIRRLGLKSYPLQWKFLHKCEDLLLSVISDSRFLGYLPSEMATATMCLVIQQVEPCNALDYQNQFKSLLEINEAKFEDCSKLILEALNNHGNIPCRANKRKYDSIPGSPNGVIDAYFSSDNSNDSWAMASSVSSSPEPLFKKSRAQDQQMRLAPLNRISIGLLSRTH